MQTRSHFTFRAAAPVAASPLMRARSDTAFSRFGLSRQLQRDPSDWSLSGANGACRSVENGPAYLHARRDAHAQLQYPYIHNMPAGAT